MRRLRWQSSVRSIGVMFSWKYRWSNVDINDVGSSIHPRNLPLFYSCFVKGHKMKSCNTNLFFFEINVISGERLQKFKPILGTFRISGDVSVSYPAFFGKGPRFFYASSNGPLPFQWVSITVCKGKIYSIEPGIPFYM